MTDELNLGVPPVPTIKMRASRMAATDAFCATNGILSHSMAWNHDEDKWVCLHRPTAERVIGGSLPDIASAFASHGERLGDASAYGKTRREAVRNLCEKLGMKCEL